MGKSPRREADIKGVSKWSADLKTEVGIPPQSTTQLSLGLEIAAYISCSNTDKRAIELMECP